jgi:MoxR-like ATPase
VTGKLVNLSRARKARAREEARRKADANAARHGRTRADREADRAKAEKAARHLDAHRREDDEA